MAKDLHAELKKEMVHFSGLFKNLGAVLLPSRKHEILQAFSKIQRLANQIGGVIQTATCDMKKEVDRLVAGEMNIKEIHLLLEQILTLEQETREL